MKPQTYMIYYKDARGTNSKFYGPFVSEQKASAFADDLPEPQQTGLKAVYPVSQFTFDEVGLALQEIILQRKAS